MTRPTVRVTLGFEQTLREAGLKASEQPMHFIPTTDEKVASCAVRTLSLPNRPTAIICATDTIALACMNIILKMGLRIPEDVSQTGIDDTRFTSHHAIRLTTVGHREFAMGEIAAANLIESIEHDDRERLPPRQITLVPELIVRNSTGPVPADR